MAAIDRGAHVSAPYPLCPRLVHRDCACRQPPVPLPPLIDGAPAAVCSWASLPLHALLAVLFVCARVRARVCGDASPPATVRLVPHSLRFPWYRCAMVLPRGPFNILLFPVVSELPSACRVR